MKITMICGSPRKKHSTSLYLLNALTEMLESGNEIKLYDAWNADAAQPILEGLSDSGALVIACPLYVDSLPSNLLEVLAGLEKGLREATWARAAKVYLLVNNGFYDAIQNRIAIDQLWKWCDRCGLQRGSAIGIGAGGMIQMFPVGKGPFTELGKAFRRLAGHIQNGRLEETVFIEPNFPRRLYQMAAHAGWRKSVKANGLKASDLTRT